MKKWSAGNLVEDVIMFEVAVLDKLWGIVLYFKNVAMARSGIVTWDTSSSLFTLGNVFKNLKSTILFSSSQAVTEEIFS